MKKNIFSGINIQYPISRLIMSGEKTIETRTYPIPKAYIGKDILVIETPGKVGKFKARIIGIVRFGDSFQYRNKTEFYKDEPRHKVSPNSPWAWKQKNPKWGWPIIRINRLKNELPAPQKRGIKFIKEIELTIT